jgi:transposase-like protein
MDIKPFFDLLGKQSAVARAFGVTDAAVLKWRRDGRIPAHRVERGAAILAAAALPEGASLPSPENAAEAFGASSGAIPATVVE